MLECKKADVLQNSGPQSLPFELWAIFMADELVLNHELISDPRLYELASFFGINERGGRIQHKDALVEIMKWAEETAKTDNWADILLTVRQAQRHIFKASQEPPISAFRRFVFIEEQQKELDSAQEQLDREKQAIAKKVDDGET